jgi:elongation factor G
MTDQSLTGTRNFALIGHAGDGKTSLAEALLHRAGAIASPGSVDEGSSHLDTTPEEKERHHTLSSSVYSFSSDNVSLTLVDTPGDPNFQGDSQIVTRALDSAVLVVGGVGGAKVGTESMWRASERGGVPVLAFVNALDHDRADFAAAVESLKAMGANATPITLPIRTDGSSGAPDGVIDLSQMQAWIGDKLVEIPEQFAADADVARAELVEAVAECDDELLEKYLEEGELSDVDVQNGLIAATRSRQLVPVLGGAALEGLGVAALLTAIEALLPSPADRSAFIDEDGAAVAPDADAPLSAVVFKTVIDRYAGKLSIIRVVAGSLSENATLVNTTTGARERIGKLFSLQGAEHVDVHEAGPGDVVAVAKLKDTHTGDTLRTEKGGASLPAIPVPHGVLSYAITAREKADEDKVFASLGKLVEEDPVLKLGRDPATGEFLLTGMGELHIRMTGAKLKRLYDVEIELKTPKVPYRETITRKAENVEGKLKKQSGGKGMFGVCYLSLEPAPRGSGIEFVDQIVGGSIPRNLIPAVEKGCMEASEAGPLAGYPVVDVRVRCIDGKHHSVDSNEMAFKLAGSFGFKEAIAQGKPTLLEPVMNAEITVPDDHLGDLMGDLSGRRGRVQGTEARGSSQVIKAEVPMAEMLEYASALTALTGGKGAFHMEFSHYDDVPASERDKIIANAQKAAEEEA